MNLAVDVDGVLANHAPFVIERIENKYGVELSESQITSYRQKVPGVETDVGTVYVNAIEEDARRTLLSLPVYPQARNALSALKSLGHSIHIATHRPTPTHPITKEWLETMGIPFDTYHTEVPSNKGELPIDALIDDFAVNIDQAVREGVHGILMERGWSDCSEETQCPVVVQSWNEIEQVLAEPLSPTATTN